MGRKGTVWVKNLTNEYIDFLINYSPDSKRDDIVLALKELKLLRTYFKAQEDYAQRSGKYQYVVDAIKAYNNFPNEERNDGGEE